MGVGLLFRSAITGGYQEVSLLIKMLANHGRTGGRQPPVRKIGIRRITGGDPPVKRAQKKGHAERRYVTKLQP